MSIYNVCLIKVPAGLLVQLIQNRADFFMLAVVRKVLKWQKWHDYVTREKKGWQIIFLSTFYVFKIKSQNSWKKMGVRTEAYW